MLLVLAGSSPRANCSLAKAKEINDARGGAARGGRMYEVRVDCNSQPERLLRLGGDPDYVRGDWVESWTFGDRAVLLATDAFSVHDLTSGKKLGFWQVRPNAARDAEGRRVAFVQRLQRFTPDEASSSILHILDVKTSRDTIVYPEEQRLTKGRDGVFLYWTPPGASETLLNLVWSPDGRSMLGLWEKEMDETGRYEVGFLVVSCGEEACSASLTMEPNLRGVRGEEVTGIESVQWGQDEALVQLEGSIKGGQRVRSVEIPHRKRREQEAP